MGKSYRPEVTTDNTGKFYGNAVRLSTREEAEGYVANLAIRWTAVRDTRVIESEDPVNYVWTARGLVPTKETKDA